MDLEAYKVAVRLSLTENISAGLLAVSRRFADTHHQAALFQAQMKQIGRMTIAGGGLTAVGLGITKGLDATLKAARDLVRAQTDFRTLNLSAQDNAAVTGQAQLLAHQTLGTTIAGNIRLIQDLHTAFGDLHHAVETAPEFARYEATVRMALGKGATDGLVNAAAKALEHRGGAVINDPARFLNELSMMSQVQLASRGRVSPKDFLAASQTGKAAYMMLDPQYLYGQFAGLMSMDKGGNKSGTALMTAFSSLIGGHMDRKAKGLLAEIGMLEEGVSPVRLKMMREAMRNMSAEERDLYRQSLGSESVTSGGLKPEYARLFSRPDKLAAVMADKIRQRYGSGLTDDDVGNMLGEYLNRNAGQFYGQHIKNAAKLSKDATVFHRAQSYSAAYDTYLNSPDGAAVGLTAAWTNLKAILGLQLLPTVTSLTLGLTRFIDKLSQFAEDNPWATRIAAYSSTALAGLTLLSGGILLLSATIAGARLVGSLGVITSVAAMLGGPVTLAIAAVAGASVLIYSNWARVRPALKGMWREFSEVASTTWAAIKGMGQHFISWWEGIESRADKFGESMQSGFNRLFDYIIGLLNNLPGVNIPTTAQRQLKKSASTLFGDIEAITRSARVSGTHSAMAIAMATQGRNKVGVDYAKGMQSLYRGDDIPPMPHRFQQMVQVHSRVYLDKKAVGEAVTQHQVREATRAPTGISRFDPSMLLTHPGQVSNVFMP
ncbi:hypothetical protein ACFQW4_00755 [Pantoea sp. GCM10028869]|uniref:hypothetical protein n=1 Tax=Pantoea sp. GCM10028869 TaxID=3273417 RepID=UPI00360892CC